MTQGIAAAGTAAAGVLGFLIGRWDQTHEHYRHVPAALLLLELTLGSLGASVFVALFTLQYDLPGVVFGLQTTAILIGLMFLLKPLAADLHQSLREAVPEAVFVWASLIALVALGLGIVVGVFLIGPTWAAATWVGVVAILFAIRVKFGPPVVP